MNWRDALTPEPQPRAAYLATNLVVNAAIGVVTASLVAALTVSRASHHHVTGVFVAGMIAFASALSAALTTVTGTATGLLDTAAGLVLDATRAGGDDPHSGPSGLAPRMLWRRAGLWFFATLAWAGGLGLVLAAVLNGRVVGYAGVFAAMVVATVLAGATAGAVATARGIAIAHTLAPLARADRGGDGFEPAPVRARAWRAFAPPLTAIAFVGGCGAALVLFHDANGSGAASSLTKHELLADLLFALAVNAALFGFVGGRAGRAEAGLGVIASDDPITQLVTPKAPLRRNAIGWSVFIVLLAVNLLSAFIPNRPSLFAAALIRGLYSAAIAYVASGLGYVRGALNGLGVAAGEAAGVSEARAAGMPAAIDVRRPAAAEVLT